MSIVTTHISPEEYLERERVSAVRHEYLNGEVREMVGASRKHTDIVIRLISFLYVALKGTGYQVRTGDTRLKVMQTGLYTYSDVCVITEDAQYEDAGAETVLNPTLVIEVLSPSTEDYDRGEKFQHYQHIDAFREYVLIAQDRPLVEHFQRATDGVWKSTSYNNLTDVIPLASINLKLPLVRIYEDQ